MTPQYLQKLSHDLLQTHCHGASPERLCNTAKAALRILTLLEVDGRETDWGSYQAWRNKLKEIYNALQKAILSSPSTAECAHILTTMINISAETVAIITPTEREICEIMANNLVENHMKRVKGYFGEIHWETQTAILHLIIMLYAYQPDPDEPALCFLHKQLANEAIRIQNTSSQQEQTREETAAHIALLVRNRNAFLDKSYDNLLSEAIRCNIETPVNSILTQLSNTTTTHPCAPIERLSANDVRFLCLCHDIMNECISADHLGRLTHRLGHLFLQQSLITSPDSDLGNQVRTQAITQGITETMTAARLSICCNCG